MAQVETNNENYFNIADAIRTKSFTTLTYTPDEMADAIYAMSSTVYGTCDTAAASAEKIVAMPQFLLVTGAVAYIKFTYANSAANPTLNINNTGAMPIYTKATAYPSTSDNTSWEAGATVAFTYDGAAWIMNSAANSSGTYISYGVDQPLLSESQKSVAWNNLGFNNHDHTLAGLSYSVVAGDGSSSSGGSGSSGTSQGLTISILGDSISTYEGWVPEGNAVHYHPDRLGSVYDTWWMKVIQALGLSLQVNNAWSGSRVTTTDGETSAGCMTRCQSLGTDPSIIIVWLGINDFNNDVPLGTYNGNGDFPVSTTTFREAYAIMLHKILTKYKTSRLYCCTLPPCERNDPSGMPPEKNDNGVLLNDFNNAIRELSNIFGAKIIELAQCGINYENLDINTYDWQSNTGKGLHPNAAGFSLAANEVIKTIDPACRVRW